MQSLFYHQPLNLVSMKDKVRLAAAMAVLRTRPPELSLTDYLTQLRLQAHSRRKEPKADIGEYRLIREEEDWRGIVVGLLKRVAVLEADRDREGGKRRRLVKKEVIEDLEELDQSL